MRATTKWVATLAVFMAFAVPGMATTIGPGGSGAPDPLAGSTGPFVVTTGVVAYVGATFSGQYDEAVFKGGVTAVCPLGGCFVFQLAVTDAAGSTDPIERITLGNFGGWLTDVGMDTSLVFSGGGCSSGTNPDLVNRSGGVGNVVGWNFFTNNINPGQCSAVLIVDTNATNYQAGNIGLIDTQTVNLTGYAPAAAEPASATLLLVVIAATALLGKKRTALLRA